MIRLAERPHPLSLCRSDHHPVRERDGMAAPALGDVFHGEGRLGGAGRVRDSRATRPRRRDALESGGRSEKGSSLARQVHPDEVAGAPQRDLDGAIRPPVQPDLRPRVLDHRTQPESRVAAASRSMRPTWARTHPSGRPRKGDARRREKHGEAKACQPTPSHHAGHPNGTAPARDVAPSARASHHHYTQPTPATPTATAATHARTDDAASESLSTRSKAVGSVGPASGVASGVSSGEGVGVITGVGAGVGTPGADGVSAGVSAGVGADVGTDVGAGVGVGAGARVGVGAGAGAGAAARAIKVSVSGPYQSLCVDLTT